MSNEIPTEIEIRVRFQEAKHTVSKYLAHYYRFKKVQELCLADVRYYFF